MTNTEKYIKINGVEYDPYYVLDCTGEDTDEHINKMFKKKIKLFHPDKIRNADPEKRKKYDLYMQIIMESYEWIKHRREETIKRKRVVSQAPKYKQVDEKELDKLFNKVNIEDNDNTNRFSSIKEYENFNTTIADIFKDKRNTSNKKNKTNKNFNEEFNEIFEYVKEQHHGYENESYYKSTDGFNCNDQGTNFASVSSYRGLLISSDVTLGDGNILENGVDNYYKKVYDLPNNPSQLPKQLTQKSKSKAHLKEPLTKEMINKKLSEHTNDIKNVHRYTNFGNANGSTNFINETEKLHNKIYTELVEKEEYDKHIIEKYGSKIYDKNVIEEAKNGQLDCSPTFLSKLKEHHKLIKDN